MLRLFQDDPDFVRWVLTNDGNDGCRLVVHYADGTWIETFASAPQALKRVQDLEDLLDRARTGTPSDSEEVSP